MKFIAVFIIALLTGLYLLSKPVVPLQDRLTTSLVTWLDCQKRGETGQQYWLDSADQTAFFNLESYEIVANPSWGNYTIRIHSTRRNGNSIVQLFRVVINADGKIVSLKTNEEYLAR